VSALATLRPFARDLAWLGGSQALLKALALLFSLFLARTLGAEELGRYAAALAFAGLFGVASGPGAASFGTREMARDPQAVSRLVPDIALLRTSLALLAVPALASAAWGLGRPPEAVTAVTVAGLGLPLHALVATFDSALVARGLTRRAALWAALRQAVFMVVGGAALVAGGRSLALLVAGHVAVAVRALGALFSLRRLPGVRLARPAPSGFPALLRRLLPFSLEGVADQVGLHAPVAVLALASGESATGLFAAAFALVLTAQPFAQGLGTALTPRLTAPGGRALLAPATGAAVRLTLGLGLPLSAVGALGATELLRLAYGAAFVPAAPALRFLLPALPALFAGEALRAALLSLGRERALARGATAGALAALLLTALLSPTWGASGAAAAFLSLRLIVLASNAIALARALPRGEAWLALGLSWGRA
jgi:O-antigen/teichoic acid export membrane protein